MSCNPRSTTPCQTGRLAPSPIQAMASCGGVPSGFLQSSCVRSMKPMVKSTIPKRGPPPALPKRIDYKKPQMTKAMIQRLRHTQKFQDELERKERERVQPMAMHRPRRSRGSTSVDGCIIRERQPTIVEDRGRSCLGQSRDPSSCSVDNRDPNSGPAIQTYTASCTLTPGQSRTHLPAPLDSSRRVSTPPPVSPRTRNLAKSMNADIVQAEPLQRGPVDNIIIPPGAINSERTTIVSIPQPDDCAPLTSSTSSPCRANQMPNRSVQAISETLNKQDAVEVAVVNSKLQDLQQARRDFVMAVASVGGNTISLQDEDASNISPISDGQSQLATPNLLSSRLISVPSLEDPCLQVEYGRHHPVVEAAREYMRGRQTERNIDENFARIACQPVMEDIEQDYLEGCGLISTGINDDDDICVPMEQYTMIPRKTEAYRYDPLEVDRLERFFDLQSYPPPSTQPQTSPPPGRECLHPDLWELDDPWYRESSAPDLIDWRTF